MGNGAEGRFWSWVVRMVLAIVGELVVDLDAEVLGLLKGVLLGFGFPDQEASDFRTEALNEDEAKGIFAPVGKAGGEVAEAGYVRCGRAVALR